MCPPLVRIPLPSPPLLAQNAPRVLPSCLQVASRASDPTAAPPHGPTLPSHCKATRTLHPTPNIQTLMHHYPTHPPIHPPRPAPQNILWGFLSFLFWICTFSTTLAVNMLFLFLCICFMLEASLWGCGVGWGWVGVQVGMAVVMVVVGVGVLG